MAKFVGHEECPKCGSKDNLSRYDDGYAQCENAACGYYERSDGTVSSKETKSSYEVYNLPEGDVVPTSGNLLTSSFSEFSTKIITQADGSKAVMYPYYVNNRPVGAKVRLLKDPHGNYVWGQKKFFVLGKLPGLFGLQQCSGKKGLIITEGEVDAISAKQMYGLKYDVVSISKGAKSAKNAVLEHIDFVSTYEKVILALDNDEPGQLAVDEILSVIPAGIGHRVLMPDGCKDATDVLKQDKTGKLFRNTIDSAKADIPESLLTGSALAQAARERTRKSQKAGIDTGFPSLNRLSGGFKPGEIITIVAGTGVGKTTFTCNMTYNISVARDYNTLFIPLEMSIDNIVNRMYELHTGNKIYTPDGVIIPDDYEEVIDKACQHLVVYDHIGGIELEKLEKDIRFAASAYKLNAIVLDHLHAAIATLGEGNDYRAIDFLMGKLKKIALDCNLCIILVSHQSRSSDDKDDNKASLARVRGSQGVAQNSDMVLGLERERDSHVTRVKTLKAHRLIGQFGDFELLYNSQTKRMEELDLDDANQQSQKAQQVPCPKPRSEGDTVQVGTGEVSSREEPRVDVRSSETIEVLPRVQPRLSTDNEVREGDSDRDEGTHERIGQIEDDGSQEIQSEQGHTVHVPESEQQDPQEQQVHVRGLGGETRVQMVQESIRSQGVDGGMKPYIVVDLETSGLIEKGVVPEIVCYSVSNDDISEVHEGEDGLEYYLEKFTPIFHNASFDVAVLRGLGFEVPVYEDTMLLANAINSNRPKSLKDLAQEAGLPLQKISFDMKAWKKEGCPCTEELMEYCLFDTKVTWLLWKHLNEECSESSLNYYRTVELPYSEIIMEMEKTGFVVDIDQAHLFANELTAEADAILADILAKYPKFPTTKEYKTEHPEMELLHTKEREDGKEGLVYVYRVYEDFNPNSTQHKIWALMQEGWKPEKVNKKSGQPTCDKHTLAGIAHKFPIAKQFTKYNRIQKVLGSFVKPFVEKCDDDHILRGSFNQCGTVTGRLSSSDPNLQNIPAHGEDGARMRSLIIAPNGYKVVGGDLSNIEARILAYYLEIVCKDSIMANAFRKGLDLHWENAKAWGLAVDPTLEDGKKDPGRNYAKTVLYLSMYGGGIAKLAQTLDISEKEAQKIMNTFEKNCPALNQLKTLVWNRMKRAGHITTLLGRPLSYPDINSSVKWKAEAAQRQTFNALIQGTAADLIKDLSVKTRATAARHNAMFVASVHDEQIFYCPEETAFAFAAEVTAIWSVQTYLKDIEVTAEFEVGDTWNQVK